MTIFTEWIDTIKNSLGLQEEEPAPTRRRRSRPRPKPKAKPRPRPKPKATLKKPKSTLTDISSYKKIRKIGSGASGEVWLCRNNLTKLFAAMKIISRKTKNEKLWATKEFKALLKFEHMDSRPDSLIRIGHSEKTADGLGFCYVMPLADGVGSSTPDSKDYKAMTLGYKLRSNKMLSLKESAEIVLRVLEALQAIHSVNLIHRDVKPDNIIFIKRKAVLADIGLVTDDLEDVSIAGTPLYCESGKKPSKRGDLYALGKVLYQMINGKRPDDFPSLGSRRDNKDMALFAPLNDVCMRACGDEKDSRYENADQMIEDLQKALNLSETQHASPIERK